MEQIMNYVKPELIVVAIALYFIAIWVLATGEFAGSKDIAMAVFTAITQGVLVAGLSTYVNQIVKQIGKTE